MRYGLDFPDDRDGFEKRHAFRLVHPIGYARERKRRPLYVSRKRVSDNNSSLSSDRLDANRLTSEVSEHRGVWASLGGSGEERWSLRDGLKTLPRWNWHVLWMLLQRIERRFAHNFTNYAIDLRLFIFVDGRNELTKHYTIQLRT